MRSTGWRTAFAARAHRQRFLGRRTRLAPHASAALPRHAQARGRAPTLVPLRSPDARVSACQRGLGAQGAAALVVAHFMLLRRQRLQHCPAAAAPPRQRGSAHPAAVVESCDARCLGPRMRQSGCGQAKGGTRRTWSGWFRRSFLASGAYGEGQLTAAACCSFCLAAHQKWLDSLSLVRGLGSPWSAAAAQHAQQRTCACRQSKVCTDKHARSPTLLRPSRVHALDVNGAPT